MKRVILRLPFPPSTNTYWRKYNNRVVLSQKGRDFKQSVLEVFEDSGNHQFGADVRLQVNVWLYPPDKRKRDIDNFGGKSLLDALVHAGVMQDDSQVDTLDIQRMRIEKPGLCIVEIKELDKDDLERRYERSPDDFDRQAHRSC